MRRKAIKKQILANLRGTASKGKQSRAVYLFGA